MKKELFHGLVVFLLILLGSFFTGLDSPASAVWPATGFAVGFYYYNRKSLIPISVALFIGALLYQTVFTDNSITLSIFFVLSFTFVGILEVIMFPIITDFVNKILKKKNITVKYSLISYAIISIIGASLIFILFGLRFDLESGISTSHSWFAGDFFGMMIFTSIYMLSKNYDKEITSIEVLKTISFATVFGGLLVLFFQYIVVPHVEIEVSLFLIPFFILGTFFISYRLLGLMSVIYISVYQIMYVGHHVSVPPSEVLLDMNITLVILILISILLRDRMIQLDESKVVTRITDERLTKLLTATTGFFEYRSFIDDSNLNFNEDYLERVFDIATSLFDSFDGASCYIERGESIYFVKTIDYDIEILNSSSISKSDFSFNINHPLYVLNAEESIKNKTKELYGKYKKSTKQIKESVYLGIQLGNGLHGGLSFDIFVDNEYSFTSDDLDSFSYFQSTMNHLFEDTYQIASEINIKDNLVIGLIRALEVYDFYTKGHSEDVARISNLLAKESGLSSKVIQEITYAGLLHDIGKIGISQHIINKQDRLEDDEYDLVKNHSLKGYEIITSIPGMEKIAHMILHHHEYWNGQGYPNKLKGDEIPLGSQIISVADAVSTMKTGRPYARKKSIVEIIDELERCKGTQFNPTIANIMIVHLKYDL